MKKVLAGVLIAISILMFLSTSEQLRNGQLPAAPAGAETAHLMGLFCPSVFLLCVGLILWKRAAAADQREFRGIK